MMKLLTGKRLLILPLLGLLVIGLLWPIETTVVPEWKIRVVDRSGSAVSNVPLRETWQHYSIESRDHEQDLPTNGEGYVTFPPRTAKANLVMRAVGTLVNGLNPHGSTGPAASVYVLAPYKPLNEELYYSPGRPLPTQFAVQHSSATSP